MSLFVAHCFERWLCPELAALSSLHAVCTRPRPRPVLPVRAESPLRHTTTLFQGERTCEASFDELCQTRRCRIDHYVHCAAVHGIGPEIYPSGLRPERSARFDTVKLPKPINYTASPLPHNDQSAADLIFLRRCRQVEQKEQRRNRGNHLQRDISRPAPLIANLLTGTSPPLRCHVR